MFDNYVTVDEKFRKQALERLNQRIAQGEDPYEILRINPSHKFYVDKILSGLMPLSYTLYSRIMYNEEPEFDVTT